jgi:HD-GYP domain-containing protein (c-di-GMP phosphodiesterase class II)
MASTATAAMPASPRGGADLDPVDLVIEESRARQERALARRDLQASAVIGGAFLVTASTLAVLLPSGGRAGSPWLATLLVVAYAALSRVEFEVGSGVAVPTALVFVPMLFLVPLRIVPLCVAAGLLLRDAPEMARGRVRLERGLLRLVNSWYAVGPVLVLAAAAADRLPTLGLVPLYLCALAAQFLLDFGSAAARERLALGVPPREILRFIVWAWLVDLALAPIGLAIAIVASSQGAGVLLALPLVGLIAVFARERTARIDHALELSAAYRGTALLLGDVVEADDAYTGAHSRDVVSLVLGVCDELGLSARERRDAEFVALLHDVGKIRIPSEIINKPGALTPEERAVIETHTIEGERLLAQVGGLLGQVGAVVRSCHERWDGEGYPDRLAGEATPRIARIVCACDAYSAMTTNRSYRAARPPAEALEELRRCSGAQFDPAVVEALCRVLGDDR